MPIGFVITAGLVAFGMLMSVWPPYRSGPGGVVTWIVSALPNESPFLAFYWMGISTWLAFSQRELHGAGVWAAVGLALASFAGTPILMRRSLRAGAAVEHALDRGLGPGWRQAGAVETIGTRVPWARILFAPLPLSHRGVRRISRAYGDAGRRNRLDLYRSRRARGGPVLIHLHGGGSSLAPGRKSFYARRLLFRLAREGWVCISANYRLGSAGTFPQDLIDVKRMIVWARAHATEHNGDPDRIVLAGSSYGARLATLAGFTTGDPALQPGFEAEDTSVAAVVGLYGYYGATDSLRSLPSSPFDYADRGSPPLLIVHGDQDTLTSASTAHKLADRVAQRSVQPVVYAELPGAQHSFDLLTSIRFEAVIDGIQAFEAAVSARGLHASRPAVQGRAVRARDHGVTPGAEHTADQVEPAGQARRATPE
jgi:acetyl esterase/lipase